MWGQTKVLYSFSDKNGERKKVRGEEQVKILPCLSGVELGIYRMPLGDTIVSVCFKVYSEENTAEVIVRNVGNFVPQNMHCNNRLSQDSTEAGSAFLLESTDLES